MERPFADGVHPWLASEVQRRFINFLGNVIHFARFDRVTRTWNSEAQENIDWLTDWSGAPHMDALMVAKKIISVESYAPPGVTSDMVLYQANAFPPPAPLPT